MDYENWKDFNESTSYVRLNNSLLEVNEKMKKIIEERDILRKACQKAFDALNYRCELTNRKWTNRDQSAFESLEKALNFK